MHTLGNQGSGFETIQVFNDDMPNEKRMARDGNSVQDCQDRVGCNVVGLAERSERLAVLDLDNGRDALRSNVHDGFEAGDARL